MSQQKARIESPTNQNATTTQPRTFSRSAIFEAWDEVTHSITSFVEVLDTANHRGVEVGHVHVAVVLESLLRDAERQFEVVLDQEAEEAERHKARVEIVIPKAKPMNANSHFRTARLDAEHEDDLQLLHEVILHGSDREREDLMRFVGHFHESMLERYLESRLKRFKGEGELPGQGDAAGQEVQS